MKIETKHNIHEMVWIMKDNKPTHLEIKGIEIDCGKIRSVSGGVRIYYHFKEGFFNSSTFEVRESEVFKTQKELIDNL
jgi:hypothetical protein